MTKETRSEYFSRLRSYAGLAVFAWIAWTAYQTWPEIVARAHHLTTTDVLLVLGFVGLSGLWLRTNDRLNAIEAKLDDANAIIDSISSDVASLG